MKVGLIGLSDPVDSKSVETVRLDLESIGCEVIESEYLTDSASSKDKAHLFNLWMNEKDFDYIFDISGGDLANTCLPYLDLDAYSKNNTLFFGYSDLTCVLNALKKKSVLFQIRNTTQFDLLKEFLLHQDESLFVDHVVGGNICCLLKLAGTPYFPNVKGKTLFLEARSGNENRIRAYFAQLYSMHVLQEANRIVLGQFSEIEQNGKGKLLDLIFKEYDLKYEKIDTVGHSHDSLAMWIGG